MSENAAMVDLDGLAATIAAKHHFTPGAVRLVLVEGWRKLGPIDTVHAMDRELALSQATVATLTRRVAELEAERDRLVSHIREALALMMGRTQREGRNVESVLRGALSGPPNTEGGA